MGRSGVEGRGAYVYKKIRWDDWGLDGKNHLVACVNISYSYLLNGFLHITHQRCENINGREVHLKKS